MKYHTLFFKRLGKMPQNLSSAAVVIGTLGVKSSPSQRQCNKGLIAGKSDFNAC